MKFEWTEKDSGWDRIETLVKTFRDRGAYVKAGVIGDAAAAPNGEGGIDNVHLAAIHEYGGHISTTSTRQVGPAIGGAVFRTKGRNIATRTERDITIPERSFIRVPFEAHKAEYQVELKGLFAKMLDGKTTAAKGLARLGMRIVRDMRNRILSGDPTALEPNKPETIRRKGSSRPLIDKGQLLRSISYMVNGAGEK